MGRLGLAFSVFFKTLGDAQFAESARELVQGQPKISAGASRATAPERVAEPPKPKPPMRSDAVTLLAALQREGRLVDFLQEDLSDYDDAQVGAAARDVHGGSRAVLERMFNVRPLRHESEGDAIEVPAGFDTGSIQLVGRVEGEPPFRGTLNHHGWQAKKLDLPVWSGSDESATVITPAEVELS